MSLHRSTLIRANKALTFLKKNGHPPRVHHPAEEPLWDAMNRRIKTDPKFEAKARALGWIPASERNQHTEDAIVSFIAENRRKPKHMAPDLRERKLAGGMTSRMCKSNTLYSLSFVRRINGVLRDVGLLEQLPAAA